MSKKQEPLFSIGVDALDADKIVREIQETVDRKRQDGVYNDPRVARAERTNLGALKNDDEFLRLYLDSLRESVFVDINDFAITERRARFGPLLVRLKRVIWSLLKFYTYRMWSQQNQINGLLLAAVEATEERHRDKIEALEKRIAQLEPQSTAK